VCSHIVSVTGIAFIDLIFQVNPISFSPDAARLSLCTVVFGISIPRVSKRNVQLQTQNTGTGSWRETSYGMRET
jgi:hypothetical protein